MSLKYKWLYSLKTRDTENTVFGKLTQWFFSFFMKASLVVELSCFCTELERTHLCCFWIGKPSWPYQPFPLSLCFVMPNPGATQGKAGNYITPRIATKGQLFSLCLARFLEPSFLLESQACSLAALLYALNKRTQFHLRLHGSMSETHLIIICSPISLLKTIYLGTVVVGP